MKTLCVIPARFASTRLPGKPLREIAGKPMICCVYERVQAATRVDEIIVATDDKRIKYAVEKSGGQAMMTANTHETGTDRIAEVVAAFPEMELIINVQGDEPLMEPDVIDSLVAVFDNNPQLQMATVMSPIKNESEMKNPNNVKVVVDKAGYALYFSRALIPYPRNLVNQNVYKHIGMYAYRKDFLLSYAKMQPTMLEQAESLEQLRALENGYRIRVIETDYQFVGVDTEEDLEKVNQIYTSYA